MTPNPQTLHGILLAHGGHQQLIDLCADGYLPREFNSEGTALWTIRDVFYRLADRAATSSLPALTLPEILKDELSLSVLYVNGIYYIEGWPANYIAAWCEIPSAVGKIPWPDYILYCPPQLAVGYWMYILYSIWRLDARLVEVDFSSAINGFSEDSRKRIPRLISAFIGTGAPMGADVQKIVDLLKEGPLSRSELENELGVKRGVLLSRFITPAMKNGLIVPTEKGSSPKQRYKLASERR